jgi:hypothetical protein
MRQSYTLVAAGREFPLAHFPDRGFITGGP